MGAIDEKVIDIIVDKLGVDRSEVTPEAVFIDDLGADSLDLVELIMAMEEEFGMEIADEDAEKLRTVQDVISFISAGPAEPETIAIGCDHAGHGLKREILQLLHELKVPYVDLGCAGPDKSVHYPLYGKKVVDAVLARPHARVYLYVAPVLA